MQWQKTNKYEIDLFGVNKSVNKNFFIKWIDFSEKS